MKWILFVTLFASSTVFAQQQAQQRNDNTVVATVGSKRITLGEFNKKYNEVASQVLVNPPDKKTFLEELVRFEVGVQEARKRGVEKDPVFQERVNQELYKVFLEKELGNKIENNTITDGEMRAWYAQNPQIRLSDILIEVKPGATAAQRAEARKRAEDILKEVRSSKRSFEELVRLYSDDITTKNLGGDVGWQSKTSLVPAYYNAVISLKTGEISSNLVETAFGYHIVKMTGRRSYEDAPKREIRMAVFDVKRKAVFDSFFNQIKKNYQINVNSSLVD